jgi:hypothetical protein
MPRMIPIRFGGSGADRANGRNPATITAPAKITRPEWTGPAPIASRGSWVRPLALPPPSSPRCGHQGAGSPAAVGARHCHGLSPRHLRRLLDEIVRRATAVRVAHHVQILIAEPLDVAMWMGLPEQLMSPRRTRTSEATSPTPARCASTTPRSAPASARSPTLGLWQPCTHIEVAGVRLMNRDTLAHAPPHTPMTTQSRVATVITRATSRTGPMHPSQSR